MVFLSLWLSGHFSLAAFSNYNSLLVGDKTAGMGGAGVAQHGDISSMAFYNPATLAQMEGSAFSAAVGVYKKFDTVYGQDEDFTKAPLRVNQGFFRSLPASTGNILQWGKYQVGFSIVVPDYDSFKGDIRNSLTNTSTLSYVDESLWVGAALAREFSSRSSWGFGFYYTARNYQRTVSDRTDEPGVGANVFTQERTITQNAILAQAGYYLRWSPNWSFGAVLRLPAYKVSSRGSIFESNTQFTATPPGYTSTQINQPDLTGSVVIPGKLGWGLTYYSDENLEISFEMDHYQGIRYFDFEEPSLASMIEHKPTTNVQLGMQYAFYDGFKVRLGAFTNFSSHHDPQLSDTRLQQDKVDMVGFSANAEFITGSKISYTFGGYYTGGRGRSAQRVDQKQEVLVKHQHVFTMLVGTSFFF